jgi:hypothetical protein
MQSCQRHQGILHTPVRPSLNRDSAGSTFSPLGRDLHASLVCGGHVGLNGLRACAVIHERLQDMDILRYTEQQPSDIVVQSTDYRCLGPRNRPFTCILADLMITRVMIPQRISGALAPWPFMQHNDVHFLSIEVHVAGNRAHKVLNQAKLSGHNANLALTFAHLTAHYPSPHRHSQTHPQSTYPSKPVPALAKVF